jgi:hypothetical protein
MRAAIATATVAKVNNITISTIFYIDVKSSFLNPGNDFSRGSSSDKYDRFNYENCIYFVDISEREFVLSCNPDGRIRCLECGELAHFVVITYDINNSTSSLWQQVKYAIHEPTCCYSLKMSP